MLSGKVVGRVWAAKKLESLPPGALLVIELVCTGTQSAARIIALDPLGCGEGEQVLVTTGSVASRACDRHDSLIDAVVIASLEYKNS